MNFNKCFDILERRCDNSTNSSNCFCNNLSLKNIVKECDSDKLASRNENNYTMISDLSSLELVNLLTILQGERTEVHNY